MESATSSWRVRDIRDDFATILRGILSHKMFEHIQNLCDYFAPLGDTCEEITNHWRLFQDCFTILSRCLSPVVAKQLQSSEIGALGNKETQQTLRFIGCKQYDASFSENDINSWKQYVCVKLQQV